MSAIGIDFGTTYFRVGVYRKKRFEIIYNEQNKRKTPCYVARVGHQWIIGDAAKSRALEDVESVIHSPKQLIGRSYEKLMELKEKRGWHFELVKDESGTARVKFKGEERPVSPLELAARIFCEVKKMSEQQLQPQKIQGAVITVPTCFTPEQRATIASAAQIAGIDVLDIIDETWAAALAYKDESEEEEENIVVLSVGGGSYDVAAFELKDEIKRVGTGKGNAELGGQDFDAALFDNKWDKKTASESDKQDKYLLFQKCIKEKEMFPDCSKVCLCTEKTKNEITESECFQSFQKSKILLESIETDLKSIKICVEAATKDMSKSYKIMLIGGSTRIKCIRERVRVCFPNNTISHILNIDEAVVQGAALQARNVVAQGGKGIVPADNAVLLEISKRIKDECEQKAKRLEVDESLHRMESSIYDVQRILPGKKEQCDHFLVWINENRNRADITDVERKFEEFSSTFGHVLKSLTVEKDESKTKEANSIDNLQKNSSPQPTATTQSCIDQLQNAAQKPYLTTPIKKHPLSDNSISNESPSGCNHPPSPHTGLGTPANPSIYPKAPLPASASISDVQSAKKTSSNRHHPYETSKHKTNTNKIQQDISLQVKTFPDKPQPSSGTHVSETRFQGHPPQYGSYQGPQTKDGKIVHCSQPGSANTSLHPPNATSTSAQSDTPVSSYSCSMCFGGRT